MKLHDACMLHGMQPPECKVAIYTFNIYLYLYRDNIVAPTSRYNCLLLGIVEENCNFLW